jgi:hypothetical protein
MLHGSQATCVVELRRACADVITLADMLIYGTGGEASVATQRLPRRIQVLERRARLAREALEP